MLPSVAAKDDARVGATVQSIEGLLVSLCGFAWMQIRDAALQSPALLDTLVFYSLLVGSVCNVILCTIFRADEVQGAFFSLTFGLWTLYASVVGSGMYPGVGVAPPANVTGACCANSDPHRLYGYVYFGGDQYFELSGAVTFAFLTISTLISASAIFRRVWKGLRWAQTSLALMVAGQTLLSVPNTCPADSYVYGQAVLYSVLGCVLLFELQTVFATMHSVFFSADASRWWVLLEGSLGATATLVVTACWVVVIILQPTQGLTATATLLLSCVPLVYLLVDGLVTFLTYWFPATMHRFAPTNGTEVEDTSPSAPPAPPDATAHPSTNPSVSTGGVRSPYYHASAFRPMGGVGVRTSLDTALFRGVTVTTRQDKKLR